MQKRYGKSSEQMTQNSQLSLFNEDVEKLNDGAVPEKFDTITYHRSKKNRKKLDVMTAFPVKEVHHECHKQKNTALIASMN